MELRRNIRLAFPFVRDTAADVCHSENLGHWERYEHVHVIRQEHRQFHRQGSGQQ